MIAEGGGMEREGARGIEAGADLGEGLAFGSGEGADAGGRKREEPVVGSCVCSCVAQK